MELVSMILITIITFGAVCIVLGLISWVVINCYFWWHKDDKFKKPKKRTEEVIESEPNVSITERLASSAKRCLRA
jgi:hypothetical protein